LSSSASASKAKKYVPVASPISDSSSPPTNLPFSSSALPSSSSTSSTSPQVDASVVFGRPLVPFYLPGTEQVENTEQKIIVSADEYKRVNGKVSIPADDPNEVIYARTFEGGYFSEPKKVVVKNSQSNNANGIFQDAVHSNKKKKGKKGNSEASTVSEVSTSSSKYANPSFFQSPEPSEIPLPKFLDRFDIVGDCLLPPAARSMSPPVATRKPEKRAGSPAGSKFSRSAGVSSTPVKPPLVGESVQKIDSGPVSTYQLISPAKLKLSMSHNPVPTSTATVVPKAASRLA